MHRIIDKAAELAVLIDASSLYPVLLMLAIFEEKESYARYYRSSRNKRTINTFC